MVVHRAAILSAVIALLGGCFDPPAEAVARLEAVKREGAEMEATLDGLEERMLGTREKVSLWGEMADRHRRVSAIACDNQTRHATEMVALAEKQQAKARRARRVVASAEGGIGGPAVNQVKASSGRGGQR